MKCRKNVFQKAHPPITNKNGLYQSTKEYKKLWKC